MIVSRKDFEWLLAELDRPPRMIPELRHLFERASE